MQSPEAQALLETMRSEIQRYGQSVVGCDKLLLLVSANDPVGVQYGHILLTALGEGWSFEFRTDGTVRFASLGRGESPVDEWESGESDSLGAAQT